MEKIAIMKMKILKQDIFIYPYRKSVTVPDEHANGGILFNLDTHKFFVEENGKIAWEE